MLLNLYTSPLGRQHNFLSVLLAAGCRGSSGGGASHAKAAAARLSSLALKEPKSIEANHNKSLEIPPVPSSGGCQAFDKCEIRSKQPMSKFVQERLMSGGSLRSVLATG